MGLKLSVKIGDVTNLSDARYAAGMGVDYIGFNIDTTTDYFVNASTFKQIVNWVSGVGIIGEVGNNLPADEDFPPYLTETTNPLLVNDNVVFSIDGTFLPPSQLETIIKSNTALFYVIEISPEQIKTDSNALARLCLKYPVYLSSTFNEALLEQIVTSIKPRGIEIKGGHEDQPGFKDYEGIADVLEWLEVED
ncbi:MAG: hypothetical protein L3J06_05970 [Cyclobacteriaceae bacterium]|nr:hypothetical protein [Cyclobacteriaceae bacterium]